MTTETRTNAQKQAKAQLETIITMIERLKHAQECDGDPDTCELSHIDLFGGLNTYYDGQAPTEDDYEEYHDEDAALTVIEDDALSVEVRSGWHAPGVEDDDSSEYRILLCTGGPAVQIVGGLNQYQEPESVRLQYQDWFTPWEDYPLTADEVNVLIDYAQVFYFGG